VLRVFVPGVDQAGYASFLVFMGVALYITAFLVMAHVLAELKLLTTPIGETALTAWVLLPLAVANRYLRVWRAAGPQLGGVMVGAAVRHGVCGGMDVGREADDGVGSTSRINGLLVVLIFLKFLYLLCRIWKRNDHQEHGTLLDSIITFVGDSYFGKRKLIFKCFC
jgi:hypothetical protein